MSQEDRGNDGIVALLAGLGVGILIGATTALLTAPRPGSETRSQLRDSVEDSLARLRSSLDETRQKVDQLWISVKERRHGEEHAGDVAGATDDA